MEEVVKRIPPHSLEAEKSVTASSPMSMDPMTR